MPSFRKQQQQKDDTWRKEESMSMLSGKKQLKRIPTLALTDIKAALIRIFMGLKQKMMTQNDKKWLKKSGILVEK